MATAHSIGTLIYNALKRELTPLIYNKAIFWTYRFIPDLILAIRGNSGSQTFAS